MLANEVCHVSIRISIYFDIIYLIYDILFYFCSSNILYVNVTNVFSTEIYNLKSC